MWTTEQTATFLGLVANDRLVVMWWLIALRGLRRGEAAGLRWADIDLDARVAMVEQQRIANGHLVTVGPPKTAPVRLHDLRHGAASLAHCAGVDLETVRAPLGVPIAARA